MLLASRNGPLTLASLKRLVEAHPIGIELETAVEDLAAIFAENANDTEFEVGEDHAVAARKELRQWMKKRLIVERDGLLFSTDALERSLSFLNALEDRSMTSTASRLATVQQAIESLEIRLSADQQTREESLLGRIASLQNELEAVHSGTFHVLSGAKAEEGIREVYSLATSLRSDFRRVEDSFREADRKLRQRIIGERHHRGEIVDELLDGHDAMLETIEGQVFAAFHEQLARSADLEQMKQRIRSVLSNPAAEGALSRKQRSDLRSLVKRLVEESERVIQARARGERDVRAFLKSGLADEQLRVGALLQEVFQAAMDVDWPSRAVRRSPGPLPPVAVRANNLPLVERLSIKETAGGDDEDLDLTVQEADPLALDGELHNALLTLDREVLFAETLATLRESGKPMTLAALAETLPPTHDLETLAYWLTMARQSEVEWDGEVEQIEVPERVGAEEPIVLRFTTPRVELDAEAVAGLTLEMLE